MNIQVLGTGCAKCTQLAQLTTQAVAELGIDADITKVTDLKQIMALGAMMTPALAIDGVVKVAGRVPSPEELKKLLA